MSNTFVRLIEQAILYQIKEANDASISKI